MSTATDARILSAAYRAKAADALAKAREARQAGHGEAHRRYVGEALAWQARAAEVRPFTCICGETHVLGDGHVCRGSKAPGQEVTNP